MTGLVVEHFQALEAARERAADALGDRTVWCASALPDRLELTSGEPLRLLARRLEAIPDTAFTERELFDQMIVASETMVASEVAAEDVVLFQDPLTALAEAVRELGAHAVRLVSTRQPTESPPPPAAAVNAFVMAWPGGGIAALIPAADLLAAKRTTGDAAWESLLADIVQTDRDESVGGTFHPRPAVAAR